ncbi:L-cystine transporter [Lentibacillus kimchii]|uniref:L-cystine uptake protein TcyP n=1 Tax=Lentibacillus kimchii TaxID=1542911 RepID=A0ABW2UU89_9BACI
MQRKHVSFGKRVLLALVVGIVFGLIVQLLYGPTSDIVTSAMDWVNIAGNGFVSLLQMLVMPIVFFSLLRAFTSSKFTKGFGKISGISVGVLVGTVIIAGAIGVASAGIFELKGLEFTKGDEEAEAIAGIEDRAGDIEDRSLPEMIVDMVPNNIFYDFAGERSTSVIAVVIFSIIVGIAYMGIRRKQPDQAEKFGAGIESIFHIVMRVVTIVLRLTPYGILGLIANKAATSDISTFVNLGLFIIASYLAIILMFLVHMLIIRFAGLNPMTYIRKGMPALIMGFSSRSSAGTLPLNIETQKKNFGVSNGVADIAGAFSVTIGQNGCAGIYPAMLAVMVAPEAGIDPFTPGFIAMLLIVVAIGSFGVAGVGGGATFASIIVLSTLNLPIAIVGLLISIEPLIDMARTALNVSGGMLSGVLTGKITNNLDKTIYNEKENQVGQEQRLSS